MDTTNTQNPLSLFYVRAESEEGSNYDVLAYATNPEHALTIWREYWEYEDEDYAWLLAKGDVSVGLVARPDVLVQSVLQPGVAEWAIRQPFSAAATC